MKRLMNLLMCSNFLVGLDIVGLVVLVVLVVIGVGNWDIRIKSIHDE